MSIVNEILQQLNKQAFNYKGARVSFFGIPEFKKYRTGSVRATFSRLLADGLVEDCGDLRITVKGKEYIKRKIDSLKQFDFRFAKDAPKNLMVMFDVPETKKAEREWLRWQLKKFSYLMIQKSVWVGPSPLPKEFMEYVEEIGLKDSLKTFKLAKGYDFKK